MVPVGSPFGVPSGMRSRGLRGRAGCCAVAVVACLAAADCGAVLDAVEDAVDETVDEVVRGAVAEDAPGVTGKPVVGLMPGGVSGSGKGVAVCPGEGAPWAGDDGSPLRRTDGRRFAFVETNPVVPAPDPGTLVKVRDWVSELPAVGGAPAGRVSRRAGRRGASRRGYGSVSSKAGRSPCLVADGCACANAAASTAAPALASARQCGTARRTKISSRRKRGLWLTDVKRGWLTVRCGRLFRQFRGRSAAGGKS